MIAEDLRAGGREVRVIALKGQCDPATVVGFEHCWVRIGQPGKIIRRFRRWDVRNFCMSGKVGRPRLRTLWPDWRAIRFLLATPFWRMGDSQVLDAIARGFEQHGLVLVGPLELCPDLAVAAGPIGALSMPPALATEVAHGLDAALAHGRADRGQAVVVAGGTVLARESENHTDAMLAGLDVTARGGILVKLPKPQQDLRLDPPTIGTRTVDAAAEAGLAGIVIAAGGTVVVEARAVAAAADHAGLFVEALDIIGRWPLDGPPAGAVPASPASGDR